MIIRIRVPHSEETSSARLKIARQSDLVQFINLTSVTQNTPLLSMVDTVAFGFVGLSVELGFVGLSVGLGFAGLSARICSARRRAWLSVGLPANTPYLISGKSVQESRTRDCARTD
jgi:hypothetical protein